MKKIFFLLAFSLILAGCGSGLKPADPLIDLDPNKINEADSAVDDLTPIVPIGDGVTVPIYKCRTDTDCNRCQDGDVYGQTCINGTCQGSLDLVKDCKEGCSAGECQDKDEFTADDNTGAIGDDLDLTNSNDDAVVNNEDLLPDPTQCSPGPEKCPGYQGPGSVYLDAQCQCKYIYVPPGCNPNDPPCTGYSPRSAYPDCSCN